LEIGIFPRKNSLSNWSKKLENGFPPFHRPIRNLKVEKFPPIANNGGNPKRLGRIIWGVENSRGKFWWEKSFQILPQINV